MWILNWYRAATGTGSGKDVYIPVESVSGFIDIQDEVYGYIEEDELIGSITIQEELYGELEEEDIEGTNEIKDEIKGEKPC